MTLRELGQALLKAWRTILAATIVTSVISFCATFLFAPTFTARSSFLPPQQPNSAASAALASLGNLALLAGGPAPRSPAEQYVALMQSVTVSDRIIDRFGLVEAYRRPLRVETREKLQDRVRIAVGRRDGLISVEVDDESPSRAADMANAYVDELRRLTSVLAITEAQQRRMFFEGQLRRARDALTTAQLALQASGFDQGAFRSEPRSTAEVYARTKAEITSAEVRLQSMRNTLTDAAPEVQRQVTVVASLRAELARLERSARSSDDSSDYVGKYREYKYQESLFELIARQYEAARVDESREAVVIQVVDVASPPERKSAPRRAVIALAGAVAASLLASAWSIVRYKPASPSARTAGG